MGRIEVDMEKKRSHLLIAKDSLHGLLELGKDFADDQLVEDIV